MSKWIAEFDLEDGDTMPEHMDLNYMGAKIDFHCRPMWIPVSDRLPKYNTPVLLALKQIGKERTIVIGERRTRKSGWYFVDIAAYDTEHEVIAWMPLPEPYKAESEEE